MITVHIIVSDADAASGGTRTCSERWSGPGSFSPTASSSTSRSTSTAPPLMLADEFPDHQAFSPATTGHTSAVFYVECGNVDDVWERATAGGATVVRPLADVFWGEREGQIIDPFGHRWGLTQHIRDVPLDEMTAMAAQVFGPASAS